MMMNRKKVRLPRGLRQILSCANGQGWNVRTLLSSSFGRRCGYCGRRKGSTRDHCTPRSRGGKGGMNLVPCCSGCNSAKAADNLIEFMFLRAFDQKGGGTACVPASPRLASSPAHRLKDVGHDRRQHAESKGNCAHGANPLVDGGGIAAVRGMPTIVAT